jgi:hypothetical protein
VIGFAGLLWSGPNESQAAELTWVAPPECDNEVDVREQVERLIGRELESVDGMAFAVEVRQEPSGTWILSLKTRVGDEQGVRELTAKSCSEVAEAGAVVIAMAVQGESESVQPSEPFEPEPAEAAKPEVPAPVVTTPVSRQEGPLKHATANTTDRGPEVRLALGGALEVGALPAPGPGGELEAALSIGRFRGIALAALYAPRTLERADGSGGTFEFALAGVLGCYQHPIGAWLALGCAGYELGRLEGKGSGVEPPRTGSFWWQAGRGEVGLVAPLSETFALQARGGLAVALTRRDFVVDGGALLYRPADLVGRAFLGLEVRL